MGDTKAIKLDPAHKDHPQQGKTSLRCEFGAPSGWGGVVWQLRLRTGATSGAGSISRGRSGWCFRSWGVRRRRVSFGVWFDRLRENATSTPRRVRRKGEITTEWQQFEIPLDTLKSTET